MNAGQVVGVVLLGAMELVVTGFLLCVGWYLGLRLINRLAGNS